MSVKDVIIVLIMGAFGGIVRAALVRPAIINFTMLFLEALIGGFLGLIIGFIASEYTTFSPTIIWAGCGLAGVLARDLIPLFINIANDKIEQEVNKIK